MIQNELLAIRLANTPLLASGVAPAARIDLDAEYRSDRSYDLSKSQAVNV
jgi:hypothetical protein